MKRFLSALLALCLLITFLPTGALAAALAEPSIPGLSTLDYTTEDVERMPATDEFSYEFLPAGETWKTLAAGVAPATFKEVSYELADGVVVLEENSTVSEKIASAGQLIAGSAIQDKSPEKIIREGGYIQRDVLDSALAQQERQADPGTVVVDPQAGTSFKISSGTAFSTGYGDAELDKQAKALENTYMIEQPQVSEVFKDFSLGGADGEPVDLTRGNITGFAENVEACAVPDTAINPLAFGDALKDYKYLTGDKLINLQFTDTKLTAAGSGGTQLTVTLSGGLGISNINVNAKYSAFGGYHLIMDVAEEFYLVAEVQGTVQEEIRIPLFGIDIPFGIGRVSGGLYLIVGIDGDIRIEADAREYTSATMGVKGKTAFGVPVSIKGVFNKEFKKDGDVDIAGKINGYVKVGPLLDISICGLDVIGAGAFVGVGLGITADGTMLDINLYAILQIYIKIIGKTVNLIHWTPSLLHKRQQDTGGYRVHIEEAYIKIGRVGGYLEDTRSSVKIRAPEGIDYRILVYPKGVDPLTAKASEIRVYPQEGWQQLSDEGEFFYEEPETMLKGGELVAVEFIVGGKTYKSDPVPALFPFDKVTISEADYFNDFVTGNVAPRKVIVYSAQQVAKPGDPADPPEKQYELKYYSGSLLHLQGLSGHMMTFAAKTAPSSHGVYMPISQGGMADVYTDDYGNFDSRNPQMLPEGQYTPVFNGVLQIRPGAVVKGGGEFDYSKNKSIAAVKASFDVMKHTSSHTIMVNPSLPLSVSRTLSYVEGSYKLYNEGEKIVNQMQFDETVCVANGGGTRAITQEELSEFFEDGWTTQDILGFKGGKFLGENDDAEIVSHTVSGGQFTITPILDDDGNPTSSVIVRNRVIVEWVWQEHPLPTKITSADHATVSAGGSPRAEGITTSGRMAASLAGDGFHAEGSGIWPLVWSLKGAPEGISIDPKTGKITAAAGVSAQDYTFTVRLEQDPAYFHPEVLQELPESNASFGFGFNKADLNTILDFDVKNKGNPAMKDEPPVNYIGHYPAPPAEQLFTLTVTESTETPEFSQPPESIRTAPDIVAARHGYRFSMAAEEDDFSIAISATGSTPITWSLTATGERPIPPELRIDETSGLLTAQNDIAAGSYFFTVKAENDVGSDTQECILTVTEARTPPVIAEETHGYVFTKLINGGDLVIPVEASGSAPIFWSLEQKSERYMIPEEVTIDPETGVLTVEEGVEQGSYSFLIRAENDMGFDTQECALKVISITKPPMLPSLSASSGGLDRAVYLSAGSETFAWQFAPVTINSTTIRVDHIKDRYTYDRTHVNGAEFIRWNSVFKLNLEGSPEEVVFAPSAQACDSYHIYIDMTDPDLKNIVTDMGKRIQDIKDAKDHLGAYMQQQADQYVTNPWEESAAQLPGLQAQTAPFDFAGMNLQTESTLLNYGATVDAINSSKGGAHSVALGGTNGTSVTGKFFGALMQNPAASIAFQQEGAVITFLGSDVKDASEDAMFDFGFSAQAEHGEQMKAALSDGQSAFVYSFLGHGGLPGAATFEVATDIAEGTQVNVYNYEAASGQFTLIAGDVAVGAGGVVTYKNNTMSEYLITTETIKGAQVSDMAGRQGLAANQPWLPVIIVCLAAVGIAIAVWVFMRKRNRMRKVP